MSLLKDTWRGLVQRRLWPVALVLLAALAAVPVTIARDAQPVAATPEPVATEPAELATATIVTPAAAGEREQRRRVVGVAENPFKPAAKPKRAAAEATPPASTGAASAPASGGGATVSGGAAASGGGAPAAADPVEPAPAPVAAPAPREQPRTDSKPETEDAVPYYTVTVRWGKVSRAKLGARDVKRYKVLPNDEAPLIQFLGVLDGGKKAVFVLAEGVSTRGDADCKPSAAKCGTLHVEEGDRQEFVTVDDDGTVTAHYVLDLVLIRKQTTGAVARSSTVAAGATGVRARAARAPDYAFDLERGVLRRLPAESAE